MSLLCVTDLSVEFGRGRTRVLDEVSICLEPGARLGLVGASGSGKTVFASAIMGLLPENAVVSGSVVFDGRELTTATDKVFSRVRGKTMSMVFQEPMTALDPTMKVGRQAEELITLHQKIQRSLRKIRVEEVFDRVGLDQTSRIVEAYPHELSGGQRQRVIIAMALMNNPSLIICDEPTTALDATVQAKVLSLLDEVLTSVHAACLFISHDLGLVSTICEDVAVIHQGHIVETGQASQVLSEPTHPYTAGLVATANIDAVPPGQRLPVIEDFFNPMSSPEVTT
ncbi:MAG: ABC transporter ATP-binding protein [Propionibacteriaceae bacterium]|nr:ABC transporter ATP-binding protein [Propionibacteriaceae bacterium]